MMLFGEIVTVDKAGPARSPFLPFPSQGVFALDCASLCFAIRWALTIKIAQGNETGFMLFDAPNISILAGVGTRTWDGYSLEVGRNSWSSNQWWRWIFGMWRWTDSQPKCVHNSTQSINNWSRAVAEPTYVRVFQVVYSGSWLRKAERCREEGRWEINSHHFETLALLLTTFMIFPCREVVRWSFYGPDTLTVSSSSDALP